MKVFCHYIKDAILETSLLDVDIYVSKKKGHVHFAFKKPLSRYWNFDNIIQICFWWIENKKSFRYKLRNGLSNAYIFTQMEVSLCVFLKAFQKMTEQYILEKLCNKIVDVVRKKNHN